VRNSEMMDVFFTGYTLKPRTRSLLTSLGDMYMSSREMSSKALWAAGRLHVLKEKKKRGIQIRNVKVHPYQAQYGSFPIVRTFLARRLPLGQRVLGGRTLPASPIGRGPGRAEKIFHSGKYMQAGYQSDYPGMRHLPGSFGCSVGAARVIPSAGAHAILSPGGPSISINRRL
jgi:hypothetical protein